MECFVSDRRSVVPNGVLEEAVHFRQETLDGIDRVIGSGSVILGPEVAAFEGEFAEWLGVNRAVGVASGTDALTLLLLSHGIGPGDEVIMPANSVPTLCGVARCGARVRFADIDAETLAVTPETVRRVVTDATKAIVLVHLYGAAVDPSPFRLEFSDRGEGGIRIFEDCAQAHGARLNGALAGSLADGAAWSFYPTKNLAALGDGGAVTVQDHDVANRLMRLRQYGETSRYISDELGLNSRLDEVQAALLRAKLKHLDMLVAKRREVAARYAAQLPEGWWYLPEPEGSVNARQLFPVIIDDRDSIMRELLAVGVPVGSHYPIGAHRQPSVARLGPPDSCPVTDRITSGIMTLPIHPFMLPEHVDRVIEAIHLVSARGS